MNLSRSYVRVAVQNVRVCEKNPCPKEEDPACKIVTESKGWRDRPATLVSAMLQHGGVCAPVLSKQRILQVLNHERHGTSSVDIQCTSFSLSWAIYRRAPPGSSPLMPSMSRSTVNMVASIARSRLLAEQTPSHISHLARCFPPNAKRGVRYSHFRDYRLGTEPEDDKWGSGSVWSVKTSWRHCCCCATSTNYYCC